MLLVTRFAYSYEPEWALYDVLSVYPFKSGLSVYSERKEVEGIRKYFYGAIGSNGKVVIPAQFENLSDFNNGVAIAKVKGKFGLINTRGVYLLEPKYDNIEVCKEVLGMYELSENNKRGVFYNGRTVVPIKYDYVSVNYPFVDCSSWKDTKENLSLNLLNGECFERVYRNGNMFIGRDFDEKKVFMNLKGERLDSTKFIQSSKGLKILKDKKNNKFGLIDVYTGDTVVSCKYKEMGVWINDLIIATDSINDKLNTDVLINADGKELIRDNSVSLNMLFYGNYLAVYYYKNPKDYESCIEGLYDLSGNAIISLNSEFNVLFKFAYGNDYFIIKNKNTGKIHLFNAKTKNIYDEGGADKDKYSDGMILVYKENNCFYVNESTGDVVGFYKNAEPFSEGVARVRRHGCDYYDIIDKSGRVLLYGSKKLQFCSDCSEGVIGAIEENGNYTGNGYSEVRGFVYNPLGHFGYVYNQKGYTNNAFTAWRIKANEAMNRKDHVEAKEYLYLLMVNDPDANVLANYATCLMNMQYIDESIEAYLMALDMDPNSTHAKEGLEMAKEIKALNEKQKSVEEVKNDNKSNMYWNALNSICATICKFADNGNNFEMVNSFSLMSNDKDTSVSGTDYQGQYNMWANRAEKTYNSLVNLGYSRSDKSGNKVGGTNKSLSGANYVRQKKILRDAQREMRNIRYKAGKEGLEIVQSKWETAVVSY